MNPSIRLLAIDIDGTLLDSRWQLSAANRDAVTAAHRRGVEIALVTGRRFTFAQPIAAQLPVDLIVIASNGAVVKSKQGDTLARQLLLRRQALAALAAAGAERRKALLLFDRDGLGQIVAERFHPSHASVQGYLDRNREYLLQVDHLEEALADGDPDPIQVLFAGAIEPMRALAERLRRAPCASQISLAVTEYVKRDLTLLDVLDAGCSKGAALARWASGRGFAREQVMAIGDNWNDKEMLEFSGLPVVMANSSEGLRKEGWAVTSSNDESGVAAAIERFLLRD